MEEEKETSGEIDINEIKKEDGNINKLRLNNNRNNDRNKIIMYVIMGVLVVVLVALVVILVMNKKPIDSDDEKNNVIVNKNEEDPIDGVENNLGYVSCDDNTTLLNVRNSTSGNIIDGLSCYKEVTIEEELEKTDVCDKWYKISYIKNGSSYTGYACGMYIKKLEVSKKVMNDVRSIIDKANDFYEKSILTVYCGKTSTSKMINFENNMTGEYVKSEYKNISELKNYVLSFLDESLVKTKLELSDFKNPKYYDNYYEIDGDLYCRNYSGKGWITGYTGNYDIEITSVNDGKMNINIAYEYIEDDSDCDLNNLSKCSKSDFVYDIGKITINNNIITKMDFHK